MLDLVTEKLLGPLLLIAAECKIENFLAIGTVILRRRFNKSGCADESTN